MLPKSGWKNYLHNWLLASLNWFSSWGCKTWEVRGTGREEESGPVCGEWVECKAGDCCVLPGEIGGYCNWQKLRLQMAAPTLAVNLFNCWCRGLTVFCTRHPPVSKFGLQWSSLCFWVHSCGSEAARLGTHFQEDVFRDKRGEGDWEVWRVCILVGSLGCVEWAVLQPRETKDGPGKQVHQVNPCFFGEGKERAQNEVWDHMAPLLGHCGDHAANLWS